MDFQEIRNYAEGCLRDSPPPCVSACPLGVDVRGLVAKVRAGRMKAAYRAYREAVLFPRVVSGFCEAACRGVCVRGRLADGAVDLPAIERELVSGAAAAEGSRYATPKKGERVAVLGDGLAGLACAYLISAYLMSLYSLMDVFIFDYIDKMQRQDITVYFSSPVATADALGAVRHPALEYAEGVLEFPVTLRGPAGTADCGVQAIAPNATLTLLFDEQKQRVQPDQEGIVLSALTAGLLGVKAGDTIEAESGWPAKRVSTLPVGGVIAQYMGNTVYMTHEAAARISDYRGVYTSVLLKAPDEVRAALVERLEQAAQVALVENRLQKTAKMRDYMSLVIVVMGYMALLGIAAGFAVVYTSSLISFEELKREISTMMMLGLPSRQCLEALTVGQWLLTVIALGPGIALTMLSSRLMSSVLSSEMFSIPDFADPQALALAAALICAAVWFSSRMMLRKVRRLSPVDLLRERE